MVSQITVYRHIKNEVIKYTFGKDKEIPLIIFQDDTIIKVLTKIALGIAEYDTKKPIGDLKTIPYAWYKNDILRFQRINEITAKPINPWDGIDIKKDKKESVKYTDNRLFHLSEIHVVFASDMPGTPNEVYFPSANIEWKINATYASAKKESDFLYDIWQKSGNNPEKLGSDIIYTRIRYNGKVTKWRGADALSCSQLFDKMRTNNDIPFIQLVEDPVKIMYKVYKQHEIQTQKFAEWTTYDNIPKVTIITVMFTIFARRNIFGRMTIDNDGNIYIEYKLDSKEKIDWAILHENTERVVKWLLKYVAKVHINIESISLKSNFTNGPNRRIKELANLLSKLHVLYHFHKLQGNFLEVSFKRSANFKNNVDVADVILSEMRRGIPIVDIINNLIELGMPEKDALEWVQQYSEDLENIQLPKKKLTLKETGCILLFSESTTGYTVLIENIASLDEVKTIHRWIQGTLNIPSKEVVVVPSRANVATSTSTETASTSTVTESTGTEISTGTAETGTRSASTSSTDIFKEDVGELSFGSKSSGGVSPFSGGVSPFSGGVSPFSGGVSPFSGGALGKKNRGYFLKLLQQADPAIFRDHKNYARECLGNNFRQPVPLSDEEKAKIDSSEYKDAYDNSIKYGSDDKHVYNYICPRIWCPISKIPITAEQLARNNGKCPGPNNEEPMILHDSEYWDNNKDLKHNIGFLGEGKKKTEKGFCLPCCMKKETKPETLRQCSVTETASEEEPATAASAAAAAAPASPVKRKAAANKDTNYIKSTGAPLPPDRYGTLPKDMFLYLFPDESYANCVNSIKANECLLRKGIKHENNSFMYAVAYILGFNSIKKFVKDIVDKLDLFTFISCENGLLLKTFMDSRQIIINQNITLHKQWNKFVSDDYKSRIDYSDEHKLARELSIYKAYLNFIDYLKSSSEIAKNPIHLINVLNKTHNTQIVIFKRNGNDSAIVQCPMYSNLYDLLYTTASKALKLGLIIEENNYYEPLELKKVGASGVATFDINKFKPLRELLKKCPTKEPIIPFIETIRSLLAWCDYDKLLGTLNSPSSFKIETIILRPDMRIYGFMTKANITITLPHNGYPIDILPILLKILPIKKLIYLEDIYNKKYEIENVYKIDLDAFQNKVRDIGLGLLIGVQTNRPTSNLFNSVYKMPNINPHIITTIPVTVATNDILDTHDTLEGHSKKWYQIQNMLGKEIIKHYDSLVAPLLSKTKTEYINILMRTFKNIPQKNIVQITLEEMPLKDGKTAVIKWFDALNDTKSELYINKVAIDTGNEWIFSQTAIDNAIDPNILSYKNKYDVKDKIDTKGNVISVNAAPRTSTAAVSLPDMLTESKVKIEKLPSKWYRFKNLNFQKYNIYNLKEYKQNSVPNLMKYIADTIHASFDYNDIIKIRFTLIAALLDDRSKLQKIFDDPGMLHIWNRELSKKYKDFDQLWEFEFKNSNKAAKINKWTNVAANQTIWTTDLDFYILSQLLNINILIIKRLEYGLGKDVAKRNELNDLYISSYYYQGDSKALKMRPTILLYRQKIKVQKYLEFSAIVNEDKNYIINGDNIPTDIQLLINYHIEKQ